jgi:hypothetical protein
LVSHTEGRTQTESLENGVLRRTSEPNSRDMKAYWRKLHTEGFHDLHSLPNIIRVIKTRRRRWAGHVAYWRKKFIQGFGG